MSDDDTAKLRDLIEDFPISMITTRDEDGNLVSQPFAMQQQHHPFDGELWFLLSSESSTAERLATDARVNIALSSNGSWVSISGRGELTEERGPIESMWDASVEAWFPDGKEDPHIRALIVHADSAEYWDTPGGRIATLLSFVKSKATGTPMEIDSDKVDL